LDILDRLEAYGQALELTERLEGPKGHTFLLELDIEEKELFVRSYSSPAVAAAEYDALERATEGLDRKDVVLVSVESLATLRSACPNYFLDTSAFLASVEEAIA
jgi:hypothetical protein